MYVKNYEGVSKFVKVMQKKCSLLTQCIKNFTATETHLFYLIDCLFI